MAKIAVLDPIVSNKIAAGEVVERPASVIKELVENSIDAGAKSITVEIKQGGIRYMRVTDDGSGIDPTDADTAFLRHATSKIHTAEELDGITTLGFRGEALASIAAVSKTLMITRTKDAKEGVAVTVEGGKVTDVSPSACPIGTTMTVRELFYNTPARMKFLKKDSTEAGHIIDIVERIALGHPEISFRMISNEKEQFFTPGDSDLYNAVYAIYGRDYANLMIPVEYENETVKVSGLIGKPQLSRPNRNLQTFFVNSRAVVNRTLHFALSESYKNAMMVGRFPVAVLNIWMNPKSLDVNVHPAKTEVKFQNEKAVYDCVYWACKNALHRLDDKPTFIGEEPRKRSSTKMVLPERKMIQEVIRPEQFRPMKKESIFQKTTEIRPNPSIPTTNSKSKENIESAGLKEPARDMKRRIYTPSTSETQRAVSSLMTDSNVEPTTESQPKRESSTDPVLVENSREPMLPVRVVGQVFESYIIAEQDGKMLIIDQHAAHERLNFEAFLRQFRERKAESQFLLAPITVRCSESEMDIYSRHEEFFHQMGFESEDFGNRSIIIRAVPMGLDAVMIEETVLEVLNLLADGNEDIPLELEEKALFSVSCKSAIKANHQLSLKEQQKLVEDVLSLEGINTCPHGRPITLSMTKYQVEKQFKRV